MMGNFLLCQWAEPHPTHVTSVPRARWWWDGTGMTTTIPTWEEQCCSLSHTLCRGCLGNWGAPRGLCWEHPLFPQGLGSGPPWVLTVLSDAGAPEPQGILQQFWGEG